MIRIKVNRQEQAQIDDFLSQGKKIEAIKVLRAARSGQQVDPLTGKSYCTIGLAEAKDAIEAFMSERGMTNSDGSKILYGDRARLVSNNPIKRIVLNMGDGEVEVDMEGMSFRFLSGLNAMKIDEARELIDLYSRIKDWEDGLPARGS